jgi:hypothetical protein
LICMCLMESMLDMYVFNGGPCLICMCLMEAHV